MRPLIVVAALVLFLPLTASAATTQRNPTPNERSALTRSVLASLELDSPTIPIKVLAIRVSTQPPGAASVYSKFATVEFTGLSESGEQLDTISGFLGYSRRLKVWTMIEYGSSGENGCVRPAALFGGRKVAILGDLGARC